ncbi:MAG: 2-hydroxychromene-2-carboxylate isomerase [Pseudomonadota bacterium]
MGDEPPVDFNRPVLDFWFDFASTYSYPAAMLIEKRAKEAGVAVRWRPILLGPIFAAQGWDDSPFNIYPAKGNYMWRDLERLCDAADLTFQRPNVFPQRSIDAAKIALHHLPGASGIDFVRAVFAEQFAKGRNIADRSVLEYIARSTLSRNDRANQEAIYAALNGESRLRSETEAAQKIGVFGAPTFSIGSELFWGFDRMEQAIAWARS